MRRLVDLHLVQYEFGKIKWSLQAEGRMKNYKIIHVETSSSDIRNQILNLSLYDLIDELSKEISSRDNYTNLCKLKLDFEVKLLTKVNWDEDAIKMTFVNEELKKKIEYYIAIDFGRITGPILLGYVVDLYGFNIGFLSLSIIFLIFAFIISILRINIMRDMANNNL